MKKSTNKKAWWDKPKAPKAPYPVDLNLVKLEAVLVNLIDCPKDSISFQGTPVKRNLSLFRS